MKDQVVTVIEVTYIATKDGGRPEFIGLWYSDGRKAYLLLHPLDRADLLCLEKGDKGTLAAGKFTPRGN